jgi:hypothetical protein
MSYLQEYSNLNFSDMPDEEFTFNYSEKHGVELEFGLKKSKNKNKGKQ